MSFASTSYIERRAFHLEGSCVPCCYPLTALVAVVAGCGSEVKEQTVRSLPQRDLTLVTQTAYVETASPVETHQLRIQHRAVRPSKPAARRSRPLAPKGVLAAMTAHAPILDAEPVAQPVSTSPTPEEGASSNNDRELLPGKTVTVIPASSGPSTGSDTADELPPERGRTMVVRGGGTCRGRGRGPGIGIGAAPRPDFRGER
jgi:hypothetical protein